MCLYTYWPLINTSISAFSGIQANITKEGKVHLGAALGTQEYIDQFVKRKVTQRWENHPVSMAGFNHHNLFLDEGGGGGGCTLGILPVYPTGRKVKFPVLL